MGRKFVIASLLAGSLHASSLHAEDSGSSLMERGAKLFLEGILKEVEPAVKDLQAMMDEMEPALKDFVERMGHALETLLEDVEDFSAYHPPEILPNGDIILRKKALKEQAEPLNPDDQVDL
ncbi:MAG: hypothetical protein WAP44_00485 [Lentibacter algarum]|uniref:hypothetical protein n=1 Tax=Lentibacter algarum TaxID=576131 RepID=UPI003BB1361C